MGLILNTNVPSLIAQRNLMKNTMSVQSSLEKLSSGFRINRAADDAAGLSISETLTTQIRGNQKAVSNAQDGINILQIAEGALSVIGENLQRIRELTVQGANDTNSTTERKAIAQEVKSRVDDINRIAQTTRSSNIFLLDGSKTKYNLQIGANQDSATNILDISAALRNSTCVSLGITQSITVAAGGVFVSNATIRAFLNQIDTAITAVSSRRSMLGAFQNRLQSTVQSLSIAVENLQYSESRIRNLDIASESANLTRNQILQQSAISVLAQANQAPNLTLKLLQM